ncbi:hypothetical protein GMLC_30750 [Geomonas limicola]|uniref:Uncharacterized protein n=1 Tax=Geomonas limicola TaxID=2740186 RepID=A0A6V8NAG6_9BACT|nr:ferritin family protein [Geomonas limicola]GFO69496.1 hypothetical protein GMLC_30750 [Geomonas limicola]
MTATTGGKDSTRLPSDFLAILDRCAQIELKCAQVYQRFAQMHAEFPEIQTLWFKTAREEEAHAAQFKMLAKLKRSDVVGLSVNDTDTQAALEAMDRLLERMRTGYLDPEQALMLAIKLENQAGKFHSNSVVICRDPELKKLLDAMMGHDQDHESALVKALAEIKRRRGSGLTEALQLVERLAEQIDGAGLSPMDTLKAVLRFENLVSKQLLKSQAGKRGTELQLILKDIMEKNSAQLQLIHQRLERFEAGTDGKVAEELRLHRTERRQ